jgi:hypothetical protein
MTESNKIWNYESNETDRLAEQVSKDPDIAFTKPEMAEYLISKIKFNDGDVVMEPCFGKGSFYNKLPNNVVKQYCEINMGSDYLDFDGMVDITLSNPPFVPRKLFWKFHQKAMQTTTREIWWLINISSLNVFTPNRMEEMEANNWYINHLSIVGDKRWFGRYVWVQFTKENNNIFSYTKKIF